MNTYQFKTNIMCTGCIEKVTPYLESNNEIRSWHIDINDKNKILTIETDKLSSEIVTEIIKNAGYSAVPLQERR
ncbi:heavy-metal-associated domain-containing protein [Ilyomonas limi]|uniref:Heavy-metal-associated domain-containing protein n=1 Tax=Ilyomonas limi TaxID=2575867 RepID=A0A4U3L4L5_9BACT|nr:heavy-metal-associated domain-containing protein [Ilyomonas limi]TKK69930.1 heavy-metal-associated domain-containing protein [Ilyomonas limi]